MPAADRLNLLESRLAPFAPDQDFASLTDCVIERWVLDRDQPVLAGPSLQERLYVLGNGFAYDFAILPAGKRHIFDFYGPGAVCNAVRRERTDTPENIMFKARSEVFVLDRARLDGVLSRQPEIARALQEHEVRRAMRVSQRIRALISLPAKDSLRILLLDIEDEYGTSGSARQWLPVALTQEEIGDLIGSTSVHVSRTFAALEREGEIERRATTFCFKDIERLRSRMCYRRFGDPVPIAG